LRVGCEHGVAAGSVYPVLVACWGKGHGIGAILDALVEFAPSPAEFPVRGTKPGGWGDVERKPEAGETVGGARVQDDLRSERRRLHLRARLQRQARPGMEAVNASNGQSERTGRCTC
jgi:translation elongation factor EF-G